MIFFFHFCYCLLAVNKWLTWNISEGSGNHVRENIRLFALGYTGCLLELTSVAENSWLATEVLRGSNTSFQRCLEQLFSVFLHLKRTAALLPFFFSSKNIRHVNFVGDNLTNRLLQSLNLSFSEQVKRCCVLANTANGNWVVMENLPLWQFCIALASEDGRVVCLVWRAPV